MATLRRQVIADNIANADVPNFKRSVVDFESSLKRALESAQDRPELQLAVDDPRHISNYQPVDYRSVQPRRVLDYMTTSKNNGNNVDPEEELMASVQNQLMYTIQAQAVSYEFGRSTWS